ncbi:hypothetical protein JCM6882_001567 [Rhodosporidiobolus microsporus]
MLDRLPTELVAHVLSFVDPPSAYRLTKPTSLYACCLVSKRVKEVAQPLLWRAVSVNWLGDLEAVEPQATSTGLMRYARILDVDRSACKVFELEALVQSLTGLREIRVRCFEDASDDAVDAVLPSLTHLRRIAFDSVDFLEIREPLAFPSLFSLSLHDVFTSRAFLERLLVPQQLPQLRILSLGGLLDPSMTGLGSFLPALSAVFHDHLDVLQLRHKGPGSIGAALATHAHTLVSAYLDTLPVDPSRLASLRYKHLHICPFPLNTRFPTPASHRAKLAKFASSVSHLNLSTLLLPLQLQDASLCFEHDKILSECEKKGIDVLWEDALEEKDVKILITEKFRDWRLKKEKEAAERAG